MTGLLSELGRQLAERWLSLLVLPGVLFVATAATGFVVGHDHALDVGLLARCGDQFAHDVTMVGTTMVMLVCGAVLLVSAACGVLARAAGSVLERLWLGAWPPPFRGLAIALAKRRARRWRELSERYEAAVTADPAAIDRLALQRLRVSAAEPQRPTWMGDRLCSVDTVVYAEYGLVLRLAWPRLWLVASPESRNEVQAARAAFDRATALGGWGVLYLGIGVWWWPAAIIGFVVSTTAWAQARGRVDVYADLVEAFVDLHFGTLAQALTISYGPDDEIIRVGRRISSRLHKGR